MMPGSGSRVEPHEDREVTVAVAAAMMPGSGSRVELELGAHYRW